MSYQTYEQSIQGGNPREVYKFIGTYNTYRMTSYITPLTVGGETYSPLTITRNALKVGTQEESQLALEVSLPFNHPMVKEYAYEQSPPSLVCEIYRVHETDLTDSVLLWKGRVTSFTVEGQVAKLQVPAIFGYIMSGSAPTPRYQGPCNHILYDDRCGVLEVANRFLTNVSAFNQNILTVPSLGFAAADLIGGMIKMASSGESRMIVSTSALDITVTYPFSNIAVGTAIYILKGCAHDFDTCRTKFSNGARFGGFPLVPQRNPFTGKI